MSLHSIVVLSPLCQHWGELMSSGSFNDFVELLHGTFPQVC